MKQIFLSIFILITISLLFVFLSSQKKEYATLEVSMRNCKSDDIVYFSEVSLIKNDERIKLLKYEGDDDVKKITELDTGAYFLEYTSLFGKTEKYEVAISQFKNYTVDLCIDYLDYSKENYTPIIDKLKNKENYKIIMHSQGCFHSSTDTLTIVKENNDYRATWKNKQKTLALADIEDVRHFEIELNYMNGGDCTSINEYTIKYKNKTTTITDGSCSWLGFSYLTKKLWGN